MSKINFEGLFEIVKPNTSDVSPAIAVDPAAFSDELIQFVASAKAAGIKHYNLIETAFVKLGHPVPVLDSDVTFEPDEEGTDQEVPAAQPIIPSEGIETGAWASDLGLEDESDD